MVTISLRLLLDQLLYLRLIEFLCFYNTYVFAQYVKTMSIGTFTSNIILHSSANNVEEKFKSPKCKIFRHFYLRIFGQ